VSDKGTVQRGESRRETPSIKNCYVDFETRSIADLTGIGEMVPGTMTITRINVPVEHRGKGHGSKILRRICNAADRYQVKLTLEVMPSGGLNYEQLVDWYHRYGFVWNATYMYMIRRPKKVSDE
jgi:ribosomal protein S18 acetylase RimI-like enzyme